MITLVSKWPLKCGCPDELFKTLKAMPEIVLKAEPGTLSYQIHFPSFFPLDDNLQPLKPMPPQTSLAKMAEIVFFEVYENAEAFSKHINGPTFTDFRKQNLKYFHEDSSKPGWAITKTDFYTAPL